MPKVLTQYMKNVIKSTGYAVSDIAHSMAPNFFEMKEDAKSVASDLYRQIKEFGGPSEGGKSAIGKAKDTVNDVFKNMLEDISTGKFYNKERSEALMTDVAKSMGMDFDFDMDFGDDWGTGEDFDFEDTSDENIIKADRRNTRDTIVAIDTVGARLSNEIGQATAATGKMIATANLNATKALYSLNQKGFSQVTEGIIGLNNSITSLGAFMAPLSEHFQNSTKFFAETTKTLYDINNNLTAILKNTTPSPEAANNKYRQNKNTLASLMNGDSFSFSGYKDMVKENFKEAMGMYSMLGDFLGPLLKSGKGGKNFSPTGMLYTAALKKLIPETFKEAVKSLDENLGHYIAGAIAKAGAKNQNNYGLSGILASIFLPKREYNDKLSTGDYIKGKVAWDGKSRKALVEVIPTYLSKILASIQGSDEEYRFDYDRGKFVSYKDIKSAKDKHLLESARSAFGQYYSDTKSIIGDKNDKKTKDLQKELDQFVLAAFKRGADYWDINKKELYDYKKGDNLSEEDKKHNKEVEKRRKDLGLTGDNADELIGHLRKALLEWTDKKKTDKRVKRHMSKTIGQVEMARNKMANTMREWSASGDSIYNALYNNSFAMGRTHGEEMKLAQGMTDFGKLNANYQSNVLKYLDGITRLIAGLYGGTIGKRKKGKGGVKLTGSAEDIINSVTGNSTINSAETSREESTANALANSTMKPQEDDENISEEERIRRGNEALENSLGKVTGFLGDRLKGAPGGLVRLFETPFRAATEFFNKINDGFNQFLWGNPDGSKEGLFDSLIKKADESLDKIFANGIGKTIKDKLVSYKNYLFGQNDTPGFFHNFGTNTLNSFKEAGSWLGSAVRGVFNTPIKDPKYATDNGKAAGGRRVTKSGVVTVSEGELIVPSELNPFYHGKTDKRKQVQVEDEIYRNYLGSFADGGTVGGETLTQHIDPNHLDLINKRLGDREPLQNEGMTIEGHRYVYKNGQWLDATGSLTDRAAKAGKSIIDAIHKAADETLSHLRGNQSEEDKARSNVKKAFLKAVGKEVGEEAKANNGAIGAGAAIGAIGSFLTGGLIGPIGGALVGSAAGLIIKSEKVQNLLFGKLNTETGERAGGLINKELSNFLQKHGVNIGKGAALGTIGGLFMGSPVLGLILGSAAGFATSSEDFQDKLFGSKVKDANGNYTGERIDNGMISKALQEHIKKNAPKGIVGGLLGYLTTPIGSSPVLNLILGSAVGFATTSERFKNFMFGEEDENGKRTGGFVQKIRERIIWNIDDIAHNTWNQMKGLGKNITIAVTDGIKNITARLGRYFAGRVGGNKLGNTILRLLGFGANAGVGLIGGTLGKVNRGLKRHLLKTGRDIYDRRLGRNLTASERNDLRGYKTAEEAIERGDTYSRIDAALSEIQNEEEANLFRAGIKDLIDPSRNMYRNQEKALTFAESKFGRYLTKKNRKAILKYVKNGGDVDKVLDIYANDSNISDKDKAGYNLYRSQLRDYLIEARENYSNAGRINDSKGVQKVNEALKKVGLDATDLSKYELSNIQSLLGTESKQFNEEKIAKDTNDKIAEGNSLLEDIKNKSLTDISDKINKIYEFISRDKVAYGDKEGSKKALAGEGGWYIDENGQKVHEDLGTKRIVRGPIGNIKYFVQNRKHKKETGETWNETLGINPPVKSFSGRTPSYQSVVSNGEVIIPGVGPKAARTIKVNEMNSGLVYTSLLNSQLQAVEATSKVVDHIAETTGKIDGTNFDYKTGTFNKFTGKYNKIKPGDKDAKETRTEFDVLGNPHQYVMNNQGEWVEQKNDRETDNSRKQIDELRDGILRMSGPGLAGGIGATMLAAAASAKTSDGVNSLLSFFASMFGNSDVDISSVGEGGNSKIDFSGAKATKETSGGNGGLLNTVVKGYVGLKLADKLFGKNKPSTSTGAKTKTTSETTKAATETSGILSGISNSLLNLLKPSRSLEALNFTDDAFKESKWLWDTTNPGSPKAILKNSDEGKALMDLVEEQKSARASIADTVDDIAKSTGKSSWVSRSIEWIKNKSSKLVSNGGKVVKKIGSAAKKGLKFIKENAGKILKWAARVAVGITIILKFKELRKPKFHDLISEFVEPGITYTEENTIHPTVFESLASFKSYCGRPDFKTYFENHPFGAFIVIGDETYYPYQLLSKAAEVLSKDEKAIDAGLIGDFKSDNKKRANNIFEALQYDYYDYDYLENVRGPISFLSNLITGGRHTIGWTEGKKTRYVQDIACFAVKDFSFYKMYGAWESTKGVEDLYDQFSQNIGKTIDKCTKNETLGDIATLGAIAAPEILLASLGLGYYVATKGIISSASDVSKSISGTKVQGYFEWHAFGQPVKAGNLDGYIAYSDPFWDELDLIPKPNENLPDDVKFSYATHAGKETQNIADLELANDLRILNDTKSERQLKREAYKSIVSNYYDDILNRLDNIKINTTKESDRILFGKKYRTTKEYYQSKKNDTLTLLSDERTDERAIIDKLIAEQTALNESNNATIEKRYGDKQTVPAEIFRAFNHAPEAALVKLKMEYEDYNNKKPTDKFKPQQIMDYNFGNHYYEWEDGTRSSTPDKYDPSQATFDQSTGLYTWPDTKKTRKRQYSDNSYYDSISGAGSGLRGKGSNATAEFISQYDPAYANTKIGGRPFADAGCGPSVAAMAASSLGVDLSMNDAINASSGYQNRSGVDANYFDAVLSKKGIDTNYTEDKNDIYANLQAGNPVVMLGNDPRNNNKSVSPWGPENHYVLGRGITKDGNIVVEDPEMKQPTVYSSNILNNTKLGISTGYSAGASNMNLAADQSYSDASSKVKRMLSDAISMNNSEWYSQAYRGDGQKHPGEPGTDGGAVDRYCSDCSNFVRRMYQKHFGVDLGDYTVSQVNNIRDGKIPNVKMMAFNEGSREKHLKNLRPGDILYFKTKNFRKGEAGDVSHVELYAGNNMLVGQDGVGPGVFKDYNGTHGSGPTYRDFGMDMYSHKKFVWNGENKKAVPEAPYDRFLGYARYTGAGTREEVKEQVYAWLTNNGFSPAAAAGIMGNIEQECGFDNTNLTNEGSGVIAAGLFQWHDYAPYKKNPKNYAAMGRFGSLVKLADENGRDWTDVEMQLMHMKNELYGDVAQWFNYYSAESEVKKAIKGDYYKKDGTYVKDGTFIKAGLNWETDGITVDQFCKLDEPDKAAQYFEAAFERAGKPNMERRMKAAVEYYNKYSGKHYTYDPSKYQTVLAGTTSASAAATLASIDTSNMTGSQKASALLNYIFDGVLPGSMQIADEGSGLTGAQVNAAQYGDATNIQQALVNYAYERQDREHYSQDNREKTINGVYQSDCSSFAQRAYKTVTGLDIGGNTESQYNKAHSSAGPMNVVFKKTDGTRKQALDVMQPGDLVYWFSKGHRNGAAEDVAHVEMYAGNGQLIGQDASGAGRMGPHPKAFDTFRTSPDKFLMVTRLKRDILDKLNGKYNLEKAMEDGTWQKKAEEDANKPYIKSADMNKGIYYWSDGVQTTTPTRDFKAEYNLAEAAKLGYKVEHSQGKLRYHWNDNIWTDTKDRDFYSERNMSGSGSGNSPQLVTMEKILKKYKKSPSKSKVSAPAVKVETTPIGGSGSTLKPISIDKFNTTNHVIHSSKPAYSGGASGNKQSESVYKAFFDAVVNVLTDIKTNTSVTPALASSMVAFASRTQSELSTNTNIIKKQINASLQEKSDRETEKAISSLSSQLAAIIDG